MMASEEYAAKAISKLYKTPFEDLVLFENEDYFVVDKPAFVSTLEDRHASVNMISLAREYWEDAQVCHRLDKETSGALVFAKHPEAYRSLAMQFEHRQVLKLYHAVVSGTHNFQKQLIDLPIYANAKGVVKVSHRQGKEAKTYVSTLQAYRRHSLLECQPISGRMHQIRIHLSSVGAPIAGDEQYGGEPLLLSALKRNFNLKKHAEEQPLIKRVALHARVIGFKLLNGEGVEVSSPYPKDFAVVLKQLEKLG
ncbi:MAG: RluA family pseudouridine synthase [Cyclobacteriaceae bacterium]